jgi:excisionase family DNA binding protein
MPTAKDTNLLTPSEVATRLNMSKEFVLNHSRQNRPRLPVLSSVRVGRKYRFTQESVTEFLAAQNKEIL